MPDGRIDVAHAGPALTDFVLTWIRIRLRTGIHGG
jgi:hypothetical protein